MNFEWALDVTQPCKYLMTELAIDDYSMWT